MMNPHTFSFLGYLGVLLWLAVPLVWMLRRRLRTPGWTALALAVVSLVLATINSRSHVSRIEAEVAKTAATPDSSSEKREALEKARGADVADIRFAEDGAGDFIDKGGLDYADRKYFDNLDESKEPAWKTRKKSRGETVTGGKDLKDMLGADEPAKRLSHDSLPAEKASRPPIFMPEAQAATARRLDGLNRAAAMIAILVGIIMLIVDYLARANSRAHAGFPLPLPASLRDAFTPLPAVVILPRESSRTLTEELARLTRRGDTFVCFTEDTAAIPDSLPTFGKSFRPIDVLCVDNQRISDTFVFESLWYGSACFVAGASRADGLLTAILEQLTLRHASSARTRQNVHLVWNLPKPPDEKHLATLRRIAAATGFSLLLIE